MPHSLHPALLELGTELERQGSVVVNHGDYICIRLPFFASVRIRLNEGHLHFEPRFGPLGRGTSLVLTPIVVVMALAFVSAAAPLVTTVVSAFAATLAVLYDIARLIMTEGAMTRVQLLWSTRPAPGATLPAADVLPALANPAGSVGAQHGTLGVPRERVSPLPVRDTRTP